MVECLFWAGLFCAAYSYALYPLLLLQLSALWQSKSDTVYRLASSKASVDRRASQGTVTLPSVAVVLSAYNEEKHIVERVENLLALDYPADKLRFYIGCDGCSDETVSRLSEYRQNPRIALFDYEANRGKTSVLNDLLSEVSESITVFTDANTNFRADAVRMLVRHFNDQSVGAVCGELDFTLLESGDNQDGLYWRLEKLLKFNESRLGGLLGANGAIYAIRTDLYQPLALDCVIDDFMVVFGISQQGLRVKYDSEAVALEEEAPSSKDEYLRRVRIGAGNYQVFFRNLGLFKMQHPMLLFCYFSHKVVRWFTPHLLALVFLCNLILLDQVFYQLSFGIQLFLYLSVYRVHKTSWQPPGLLKLPIFLLYMNVALGHGFLRYISGRSSATWERTAR
ncbi:MAG: glycosyl transferase family 2 [Gammaproteobacteria bacterium]|nr:MAG: glycosyl transferase family 2 [Gammaproteobacteria bacterium]